MPNSFRLFKARGQPGRWYGYVTIGDVTYKIDAKHVGEKTAKHFEGTVKRHLKADQRPMIFGAPLAHVADRLIEAIGEARVRQVDREVMKLAPPARYGSPEAAAQCVRHVGDPCMTCGAVKADFDDDLPENM